MPLSEATRRIARLLEHLGNRDLLGMQPVHIAREKHGVVRALSQTNPARIAPRHESRPGRGADRGSEVKGRELHSLLGHPVQMRGLVLLRSERTDVAIPQVIDEDHDEVGFPRFGQWTKSQQEAKKNRVKFHDSDPKRASVP